MMDRFACSLTDENITLLVTYGVRQRSCLDQMLFRIHISNLITDHRLLMIQPPTWQSQSEGMLKSMALTNVITRNIHN